MVLIQPVVWKVIIVAREPPQTRLQGSRCPRGTRGIRTGLQAKVHVGEGEDDSDDDADRDTPKGEALALDRILTTALGGTGLGRESEQGRGVGRRAPETRASVWSHWIWRIRHVVEICQERSKG